jgi:hypothetical protein
MTCALLTTGTASKSKVSRAADASLQGTADPATDLGVTAPDLVEDGHWPQARRALQQRHNLAVPNRSQRIRPAADARCFLLRGEPWILFDAIGGGSTEPGLGRGNRRRLGLAIRDCSRATPFLRSRIRRHFLIPIDPRFSSCLPRSNEALCTHYRIRLFFHQEGSCRIFRKKSKAVGASGTGGARGPRNPQQLA